MEGTDMDADSVLSASLSRICCERMLLDSVMSGLPSAVRDRLQGTPDDVIGLLHDAAECLQCVIFELKYTPGEGSGV